MPQSPTSQSRLTDFDLTQPCNYSGTPSEPNGEYPDYLVRRANKRTQKRHTTTGIEIETIMPQSSNVRVGGYHNGVELTNSREYLDTNGNRVYAPSFDGKFFKCERDGSVGGRNGVSAEFVSPVFWGETGNLFVLHMVAFMKAIGCHVNSSCGIHVHKGVASIVGDNAPAKDITLFLACVTKYSANLQYGCYAQTGARRDTNGYSHSINHNEGILNIARQTMTKGADKAGKNSMNQTDVRNFQNHASRGRFVNLTHVTSSSKPTMEFRWAASTLNPNKILAHLFTIEWLCRIGWYKRHVFQASKNACKFLSNPKIHGIGRDVEGQKGLRNLINQFRQTKIGQDQLSASPIYQERWNRMWSISRRMAVKYDRIRSGNETLVPYTKEPSEGFNALNR